MLGRAKSPEAKGLRSNRGDLRASNADRADAVRRLQAHESMGHLSAQEAADRIELVEASKTPDEIATHFADLPALPARPPSNERRISLQDREGAIDLLERAHAEGRMTEDELLAASEQVRVARTRGEIDAAFHGLSRPARSAAAKTASSVAKQGAEHTAVVVKEGGRRAGKAFRRAVLAMAALMIGVILLIAGAGTGALICFVGSVLLFASAAISLVTA